MKKGFTLIELLVVVLIIGILAAIALPMYTKTVEKSRFAEVITMGKSVANSMDRYFMELGRGEEIDVLTNLDIDFAFDNIDASKGSIKNLFLSTTQCTKDPSGHAIVIARKVTPANNFCEDSDLYTVTFYTQFQEEGSKELSGKIICTNVSKELCATFGAKACTIDGSDYLCIN